MSLSTGSTEGQAFAHLAQSMHALSLRLMRKGLAIEISPIKAPYVHRYLHQKFRTKSDANTNPARTIAVVVPINRKKLSIRTSTTRP